MALRDLPDTRHAGHTEADVRRKPPGLTLSHELAPGGQAHRCARNLWPCNLVGSAHRQMRQGTGPHQEI